MLRDAGLPASGFDAGGLSRRYPALKYCVQYRESEQRIFVLRLLEDEGGLLALRPRGRRPRDGVRRLAPAAQAALERQDKRSPTCAASTRARAGGRPRVRRGARGRRVPTAATGRPRCRRSPARRSARRATRGGFAVAEYPGASGRTAVGCAATTFAGGAARRARTLTGRTNVRRQRRGEVHGGMAQTSVARVAGDGSEHRYRRTTGSAGDRAQLSTFDQRFTAILARRRFDRRG